MILAIGIESRMLDVFGPDGTEQIQLQAERWSGASVGQRTMLVYIDSHRSLGANGLPAGFRCTAFDPSQIAASIRNIAGVLEGIEAVVLLGGPRLIPHFVEPNPVSSRIIDPDGFVASDRDYGRISETGVPVGRIPDDGTNRSGGFVRILEHAENNRARRPFSTGSFALTNREWAAAATIADAMPSPTNRQYAPGWRLAPGNQAEIECRFVHINVHGFSDDPNWKGFSDARGEFVTALDPAAIRRAVLPGSTVFAETCYGGVLDGKTASTSCALAMMEAGAACVVAGTGLVFGSQLGPDQDPSNADHVAREFWNLVAAGYPVGRSLSEALERFAGTEPYRTKTQCQFIVLGDPTLQ